MTGAARRSGKRPTRSAKGNAGSRSRKPPLMTERITERKEATSQFTLKMRESLHRELAQKAFESDMTMRGYIMRALRQAGLKVTEADLVDGRRR